MKKEFLVKHTVIIFVLFTTLIVQFLYFVKVKKNVFVRDLLMFLLINYKKCNHVDFKRKSTLKLWSISIYGSLPQI